MFPRKQYILINVVLATIFHFLYIVGHPLGYIGKTNLIKPC